MRLPSMPLPLLAALTLLAAAAGAAPAAARTLTLEVARLATPEVQASGLEVRLDERAGTVSLHADTFAVPRLAIEGSLDWDCTLAGDGAEARQCEGPVRLDGDDTTPTRLAVSHAGARLDVQLVQGDARVAVSLPVDGNGALSASLQDVPVQWLRPALAAAAPALAVTRGVIDARATRRDDGAVHAEVAAQGLAFSAEAAAMSASALDLDGTFDWTPADAGARLQGRLALAGGRIAAAGTLVDLPPAPVHASIDLAMPEQGPWQLASLRWQDDGVLALEARGVIDPAAPWPPPALSVHVDRLQLPEALERYAAGQLAAHGLDGLRLDGAVAADIVLAKGGLQRVAARTDALDLYDPTHDVAVEGLHGGIDWAPHGTRPPQPLGWRQARMAGVALGDGATQWQAVEGDLHQRGSWDIALPAGHATLHGTVLRLLPLEQAALSSTFALVDAGAEGADGALALAGVRAEGRLALDRQADRMALAADARFDGGEMLAGAFYVKLPDTPVQARLAAHIEGDTLQVEQLAWDDPGTLRLDGTATLALAPEPHVTALRLAAADVQVGPALARYAQSWLATRGFGDLAGSGQLAAQVTLDEGGLQRLALQADDVDLRDAQGRFAFEGVAARLDWSATSTAPATIGWDAADVLHLPLGPVHARFTSGTGVLALADPIDIGVLGGHLRLERLAVQPRAAAGDRVNAAFAVAGIEMAQLSELLGWPRFGGNLSGGIPEVVLAGDTIELRGGLDLYVFDGHLGVSGLRLERPFGVAPALAANVHFENLDLTQVTSAFSFGAMSGRLDGTLGGVRLVDWQPVAFDAWLRTRGGGRMSYNAVNDIASVGGGGGLSGGLQTMALQLFDTFGYRRLGVRCRLRDEVCLMGGIEPVPPTGSEPANAGYTIVEGSGLPRISIIGHHRRVDWPTLVQRLQEATQGAGPVIE